MSVVPAPAKASSTMPLRFEQSRIASSTRGDRFHRRMHGERLVALGAETVHAGIRPHIGAITTVATEFDIGEVVSRS